MEGFAQGDWEDALTARERDADDRDRVADARDATAEQRDRAADRRDASADMRDGIWTQHEVDVQTLMDAADR
ncbi:MAG: hypothetical protein QOJ32_1086, partial [Frankiaceae bacterium]|nr:hypothetical protein [Frankiaceae bacterium]